MEQIISVDPDSLMHPSFIDRTYASLLESGVELVYGEYYAKALANGHIKVLKSLGLYKTTGRGGNKKTVVHPGINLIISTTVADARQFSRSMVDLFNGKYKGSFDFDVTNLRGYHELNASVSTRAIGNFATYIIYDPSNNCYKIGKSKNIYRRLRVLRNLHNEQLQLIGMCPMNHELQIHFDYQSKREFGEWFSISTDDVLDIFSKYSFVKPS